MVQALCAKSCSRCGRILATVAFYIDKRATSGLSSQCRQCQSEGRRAYRASPAVQERAKQRNRDYYLANREAILERVRTRRARPEVRAEANARNRQWMLGHREEFRAYHATWRQTPRGKKSMRASYSRWRQSEKGKRWYRNWAIKNPDKAQAYAATKEAIRSGKLSRPPQCEHCHETKKTIAHHHNGYTEEHWLDIQWLCASCHRIIHAA